MGGQLVDDPPKPGEIFESVCPYYMSIGMTYEQFWDGDNDLPVYFRKADKMRTDKKNLLMWIQGKYFYDALKAVAPVLQAFNKRPKPGDYVERPYPLTKAEAEALEEEKAKAKQEQMLAMMEARMVAINKKRKEARENGNNDPGTGTESRE